ncbi:hypothetical protein M069_1990 [Bacteroides fragilis str. B1 (UDC16-1)]|nr:hypothetical protein M069_1990 [Bacteroides fragilis str. B1 (UDC16-1)]
MKPTPCNLYIAEKSPRLTYVVCVLSSGCVHAFFHKERLIPPLLFPPLFCAGRQTAAERRAATRIIFFIS